MQSSENHENGHRLAKLNKKNALMLLIALVEALTYTILSSKYTHGLNQLDCSYTFFSVFWIVFILLHKIDSYCVLDNVAGRNGLWYVSEMQQVAQCI